APPHSELVLQPPWSPIADAPAAARRSPPPPTPTSATDATPADETDRPSPPDPTRHTSPKPPVHRLPRHPNRSATAVFDDPASTSNTARYRCSTTDKLHQ